MALSMRMRRSMFVTGAAALVGAVAATLAGDFGVTQGEEDPFAFFHPAIVISPDERRQLDQGEPVARIVHDGRGVGVFAVVATQVDGDRLVAWMRQIDQLKKSRFVVAIGRFSDPPRIEDLEMLTLDNPDLSASRTCRPGDCALKLSAPEITLLRDTVSTAGEDWRPAVQDAFRHVVLHRVRRYVEEGQSAFEPYADKRRPVSPAAAFSALLERAPVLTRTLPAFTRYVAEYPHARMSDVESFIYWSKERFDGKAIVSATHVSIVRGGDDRRLPDAVVAGRSLFATHYMNASLGLTAVLRGRAGGPSYLAYINLSDVDVVQGFLGGLVRSVIERRMRNEASSTLIALRRRLESGDPGDATD